MAKRQTYYLAARGVCMGECSSDDSLCAALAEAWTAHASGVEATLVDGVSAWLDDAGAVQLRITRNATTEVLADDALAAKARSALQA